MSEAARAIGTRRCVRAPWSAGIVWSLLAASSSAAAPEAVLAAVASGDYQDAEQAGRAALLSARTSHETGAIVTALNDFAVALLENGRIRDGGAEALAREALGLAEAGAPVTERERLRARLVLAGALLRQGTPGAAALELEAAQPDLALLAERDTLRADTLALRGEVQIELQRDADALESLREAVASLPEDPQARFHIEARLLDLEGLARRHLGAVAMAHERSRQALDLRRRRVSSHPECARSLLLMGDADRMAGQAEEAGEHYLEALTLARTRLRPGHPLTAFAESRLASWQADAGDFGPALEHHESALAAARAELGDSHPAIADYINDRANAYLLAGDPAAAVPLFEESLARARRAQGDASLAAATPRYNLALCHARLGEFGRARARLREALAIWSAVYGPEHLYVARVLIDWADLLAEQRQNPEARSFYERALLLQVRLSGEDHPAVARIRAGLALVLARLGERQAAEEQAARAERQLTGLGVERDRLLAEVLALRARLASARGDVRAATALATRSERMLWLHIRNNVRFLGERQALSYVGQRFEGRDLLLSLIAAGRRDPATARAAFDAVVRSRSLVLDEIATRASWLQGAHTRAAADAGRRLRSAREELATLIYGAAEREGSAGQERLRAARTAADEAEREAARLGAVRSWPSPGPEPDAAAIGARLPVGSALVSFVRYGRIDVGARASAARPPHYLAFVLRAGATAPEVVPLGAAEVIDAQVRRWLAQLLPDPAHPVPAAGGRARASVGSALTRAVWSPLARPLAGVSRAIVVPDGSLLSINFASLPAAGGGYLVEHEPTLHSLSAERDLLRPAAAPGGARNALIVGAPAFDVRAPAGVADAAGVVGQGRSALRGRRTACGDFRELRFEGLPGARAEALEVESSWSGAHQGPVTLLLGEDATEQAFKAAAGRHRWLHVATHGFVLDRGCSDPVLAGAPTTALNVPPLLLAGMAFAGANQRSRTDSGTDDGILTAEEVASLDLSRTEWVVLSACDTGRGQIQDGEGVLGLRRAFAIAGARTVLMSLWPVEDAEAQRFMRALYAARLEQGLDAAESLRYAQLTLLRERRRQGLSPAPEVWGAFLAVGDWR